MSEATPPFVNLYPDPSPVELYCPTCGYNLSGTTEDRCSECGEPFDRAALIQWTTAARQAPPFGPLPHGPDDHVFRLSLFSPGRLGRLFPPRPDADAVGNYSIGVRLLASLGVPFVFFFFVSIIAGEGEPLIGVFFVPLPIIIASVTCEVIIAALLARLVEPRAVAARERYFFWRNLCRCFSSHLLASTVLFCLMVGVVAAVAYNMRPSFGYVNPLFRLIFVLPYLIPLGTILWWWHCLGRAIVARGAPSAGRTVVILLIPVIGLGTLVLGVLLAILEGMLFASLCRF